MAWFNFLSKKPKIRDSEREIIMRAYKQVSNPHYFNSLFFLMDYNFKKYGYDSKEQALNAQAEAVVQNFLKNANNLNYLIANADVLYPKFDGFASQKIMNCLGAFTTLNYRIKRKEYIMRIERDRNYPSAICMETPEKTSMYFVGLIQPLLEL